MEDSDYYVKVINGDTTVVNSLERSITAEDINSSTSLVVHYDNQDYNYSLKVDENGGLIGINADNLNRAQTINALGGENNYYSLLKSQGVTLPSVIQPIDDTKINVNGEEVKPELVVYDNGEVYLKDLNVQLSDDQIKNFWPKTYNALTNENEFESGEDNIYEEEQNEKIRRKDDTPSNRNNDILNGETSSGGSGGRRIKNKGKRTAQDQGRTKEQNGSETVAVKYESVVDSVNNVIEAINGTSFINDGSSYALQTSHASVFDSVETGDSYLKSVSANLLSQMSIGTSDVGTILTNLAKQDADLAAMAQGLNKSLESGKISGYSPTYETDTIQSFQSIAEKNSTFFDENIQMGSAGKISLSDIKGLIASKTSSLDREIEDSNTLNNSLNNLINNPDIQGAGWDAFKNLLNDYKEGNIIRGEAAQILKDAYLEAEKLIVDYMDPYEDLDDSQIPEYEETIKQLDKDIADNEALITSLEAENGELASVGPEPIYGKDENDKLRIVRYDYTKQNAAKAKIASNVAMIESAKGLIETAKAAREEALKYLEKLYGLADIMNQANRIINDALSAIEYLYAKHVYGIDTPRLKELRGDGNELAIDDEEPDDLLDETPEDKPEKDSENPSDDKSPEDEPVGDTPEEEPEPLWYSDPTGRLSRVYNILDDKLIGVTDNIVDSGNPQGLSEFGNYVVGTNSGGTLFIYDKTTGEKQKITLEDGSHLGGVAYKDGYLYVANNDNVTRYDFDELLNGNVVGKDFASTTTTNNSETAQVSFLTITDDGKLLTGQFHKAGDEKYDRGGAASDLLVYDIDKNGDLVPQGTIKVPENMSKIQGACVYNQDGQDYYILTSSYGKKDDKQSKLFVSTLNKDGTQLVPLKSYKIPSGAEQVTVTSDNNLAIIYEGDSSKKKITIIDPKTVIV